MYTLGIDQDTVFLGKRANPRQIYLLENGVSLSTDDVKLCLTLTSVGPDLHLRFKVVDNGRSGAVLFEREFRDTPAADPLQIGIDDPPQSYLGLSAKAVRFPAILKEGTASFVETIHRRRA